MQTLSQKEQPAARYDGVADMKAREIVYQIIKGKLPAGFSKADFFQHFQKYTFVPVVVDGEIVGAYANDGPEIHAAVLPSVHGRWFSKRVLRWVNELQTKYGTLTTKVERENVRGHEFVRRVGFFPVLETPSLTFYERVMP